MTRETTGPPTKPQILTQVTTSDHLVRGAN